jgi:cellobiose phosphorylase
MQYGYFDRARREYIVTDPRTPTAWINYLSNREYVALVSHTGGGFSFHKDPRDRRLTRYRFNHVPVDSNKRYIYLKDEETGDVWSPNLPTERHPGGQTYRGRHGMGYSAVESSRGGVTAELVYFVPPGDPLEVWRLSLRNTGDRAVRIAVTAYVEFAFWNALEDLNIQWVGHNAMADFENNVAFNKFLERHPKVGEPDPQYVGDRPGVAFFSMNRPVDSFDLDRDAFIGPWNSEWNPAGVAAPRLSGSAMRGGNPCGALQTRVDLHAGEEQSLCVFLGFALDRAEGADAVSRYSAAGAAERELANVKAGWEDLLSRFTAETPDETVDLLFNTWNPYQAKTTFDWSRYVSFYETGIGRGVGFRDTCQDTHGVMHALPDQARDKIELLLRQQRRSGETYHIFFPHTGERIMPGISDDPTKLAPLVSHYVRETGDVQFLDRAVPYADGGGEGTVLDHLLRSLDFTYAHRGAHGIPLALASDWNDTLLLRGPNGAAESVLVGQLFCWASNELIDLLAGLGQDDRAAELIARRDDVAAAVNEFGWDGAWYLRAFDDDGAPVGTAQSEEGRIFLNTQVWAVLSGIAPPERASACMGSALEHLLCDWGLKLLAPSYSSYNPALGIITRYNLETKENGGVFTQTNAWAMMAAAELGRADVLYDILCRINPIRRNDRADRFRVEPYVYCQSLVGDRNPVCPGRGSNSWLTGTAGASMVALAESLFGIRPSLRGLRIRPCLPAAWEEVRIRRVFRGARYDITVRNETGTSGPVRLSVDGRPLDGDIVPLAENGVVDVLAAV